MFAFQLRTLERSAEHTERHGRVLVARTPSLQASWTLNQVRVIEPVGFDELVELADHHQGHLPYRHVFVEGEESGAALEPSFLEAGWETERLVLMSLDEPPAPWQASAPVSEIDEEPMLALMRVWEAEELPGLSDDELDQLAEMSRREGAALGERRFAVVDGAGTPVSLTKLRSHHGTAQVEDVYTLPAHRGHGFARTLVTHAATLAYGAHECTFIVADDDDWPKDLYGRVGFRRFERNRTFHQRR